MTLGVEHYITLSVLALTAFAWLLRLEAKVEANDKALKAFSIKVAEDAKFDREIREKFMASHQELRESMVRVETQLANLTQLVEHLPHDAVPHRRKPQA